MHPSHCYSDIMQGYHKQKAFIIAQSPMKNTVGDFWRMIDVHKVSAIVMLCDLKENEKVWCYQHAVQYNTMYRNVAISTGLLVIMSNNMRNTLWLVSQWKIMRAMSNKN